MVTLRDAINIYKKEDGAPSNSYDWYRKSAQKSGKIPIGGISIAAYKHRGKWCIDNDDFTEAIKRHRSEIVHLKQVTSDYDQGIIHGKDGDTVKTEWGGYKIHGNFHFKWNKYELARKRSGGRWYCSSCWIPAETEHNKEECHVCSDWNGCGRDCTLSRVYCRKCGKSIDI